MPQLYGGGSPTMSQLISPTDYVASGIQATAAEEMRLKIACRIVNLYEEIQSLKSKQNQLLPVSRLPPEVFCNIFSYVAHSSEPVPLSWHFLSHPYSWIAISHVSRHWRDIAVNTASLWTDLPLTNREWTEEMLKRSKTAAISINSELVPQSPLVGTDTSELALAEIYRAWEVKFPCVPSYTANTFFKNLPQSAPKLKALELGVSPDIPNRAQGFILPNRALCEAPNLQRLTLRGFQIDWKSQRLRDLKHLSLEAEKQWHRPLLTDFVEALRRMPKLESLSLSRCLPVAQKSSSFAVPTVDLPYLQELTLSGLISEVAIALQSLSIPHSSKVKLVCDGTQEPLTGPDFDCILSTFAWAKNSPCKTDLMPVQSISLLPGPPTSMNTCRLQFRAWTALIPPQEFKSGNEFSLDRPNIDLILYWTHPDRHFPLYPATRLIRSLFSTLSLDCTGTLHGRDLSITSNTFVEVFGTLPHLASISAEGDSFAKTVLQALLDSTTTPAPTLPFLSLRELVFTGARFDVVPNSLSMDDLRDCLVQRYECGGEIQTLHFQDCFGEGDEIALPEIIVDVLWDGEEIYPSNESDEDMYDEDDDDDDICT